MPKRILVVEDEEDNLTLFIHILQRMLGHTVFIAHDGHEAIQAAQANNPDIILMDLTLPKLTGWEATRSLKGLEAFRDTPIIALTAHAMSGDRERALEAGCDSYFAKPIDLDSFLKFLTPYLEEEAPAPATEGPIKPVPQPEAKTSVSEAPPAVEAPKEPIEEAKPGTANATPQPTAAEPAPPAAPAEPRSESPSTSSTEKPVGKAVESKVDSQTNGSATMKNEPSAKGEPA